MPEQFAIREAKTVKMTHSQSRPENHGNDVVYAIDLAFEAVVPNQWLDALDPEIREMWYQRAAGGRQADLDTDDVPTPCRRGTGIPMPIPHSKEFIGYRLNIILGTGRKASNIEIPDCKVNKWKLDLKDGGLVHVKWRVQASGVDDVIIGRCGVLQGKEVDITLTPPTAADERAQAEKAIAGEQKPAAGAGKGHVVDATDIFAGRGAEPPDGQPEAGAQQEGAGSV